METINDIVYELNGNPKTKSLAKRIELARINDEQRWRKDIADTRRLTAERMMVNIELAEKARCNNCVKQAVIPCNPFKIRKAMEEIKAIIKVWNRALVSTKKTIETIDEIATQVLNTPPLYATEDEAYQAYHKEMEGTPKDKQVFFESWLFNKLKGV